jgi:hypothetical protein
MDKLSLALDICDANRQVQRLIFKGDEEEAFNRTVLLDELINQLIKGIDEEEDQ